MPKVLVVLFMALHGKNDKGVISPHANAKEDQLNRKRRENMLLKRVKLDFSNCLQEILSLSTRRKLL